MAGLPEEMQSGEEAEKDGSARQFRMLFTILEQLKEHHNLEPAIQWCEENHEQLHAHGQSTLPFQLHRLCFLQLVSNQQFLPAVKYAKQHLGKHAIGGRLPDIHRLMGSLTITGGLQSSRYADFLQEHHWDDVAHDFAREFCSTMGFPAESPLTLSICAGMIALPQLLRLATLLEGKPSDWKDRDQLPLEIDFGAQRSDFQFHSIFTCPVSKELATQENPPVALPCGHVICKNTMDSLRRIPGGEASCPICHGKFSLASHKIITF